MRSTELRISHEFRRFLRNDEFLQRENRQKTFVIADNYFIILSLISILQVSVLSPINFQEQTIYYIILYFSKFQRQ